MARYLVTGGAGFIGSHFVLDWLAAAGPTSAEPVLNLDALTYANVICNEDGFDPISFGATVAVFDQYPGSLDNGGEHLKLVRPGTNGAPDFVVSDFVSVALRCEDGCAALFESDLVESEDFIGAFEGSLLVSAALGAAPFGSA